MDIDNGYIMSGVTDSQEVRVSRIFGGYSYDMAVEDEELETEVVVPEEEEDE